MLVFPGFQLLDAAGPIAAFEAAGGYVPAVVAATPGPVASSSGVTWLARPLPRPREVDTLLVAGGDGVDAALDDAKLLRFVRRMAAARVRIASICSGSLLLAAAGLLDGRSATTHWSRTRAFRERFPQVRLEADRIYVRECGGALWSSAGITAGIDLALHLVAATLGDAVAARVAQAMVVYLRRSPQDEALSPMLAHRNHLHPAVHRVQDAVCADPARPWQAGDMARAGHVTPRHLHRLFTQHAGVTPLEYVQRIRVERARQALARGASVGQAAEQAGFGSDLALRRAWRRWVGGTPSAARHGS